MRTQMKYWAMLRTLRPAPIDLARVSLISETDPAELRNPAAVAALVAALGLNDEGVDELPEHLHVHFGGLRIWQYPIQFGPYLHQLGQLGIRSYLEIGVRHGGSFVATVEYLRRLGGLDLAVGVDIIPAPVLKEYAASSTGVEVAWLDSKSEAFRELLADRGPFDLVFIDSHHEEDQCRTEVASVAPSAGMLALHDITNVGCPGVGRVWSEIVASPDWRCLEFTEQYPGQGPYMGIGLAIRRDRRTPGAGPGPTWS